ncbi:MAG: competence protein CoiA family protein [Hydrogenophaga sp.]|nr:competence protein CoiA family protein [Hydrogenophaga sp.]
MQTKLFAALDGSGAVRFVSEVNRGAACGCVCPVCTSPLIARQGQLKEWHFAHEASQERVECEVGALNMLRRVAAEMLQRNPLPTLPPYTQNVTGKSQSKLVTKVASWATQIEPEGLKWETSGMQSRPFLSGKLTTGAPFDAFILVNDQRPNLPPPTDQETAHLIYWIVTPVQADLLKRVYLEQHIGRTARWVWKSHPEYQGLVAAARIKAQQEAEASDHALRDKWARMHSEMQHRLDQIRQTKHGRMPNGRHGSQ